MFVVRPCLVEGRVFVMVWVCWKRVMDVANTAEDIALDFFLLICILSASEQQQAFYNAHDLPRYKKRCMCR